MGINSIQLYRSRGDVQLDTVQLDTSHSQRLNSEKFPGTGCCEWLWAPCSNRSPVQVTPLERVVSNRFQEFGRFVTYGVVSYRSRTVRGW